MPLTGALLRRILLLAALLAGCGPLVAATPAALQDWPSHVARAGILLHLLQGDQHWSRLYDLNEFPTSNSLVDLVLVVLTRLGLGLQAGAAAILAASYALYVYGTWAAARALGRADATKPMLAALLFHNGALGAGFVCYELGLGIALLVFAWWVAARQTKTQAAVAALGGTVIFFAHLSAVLIFAGMLSLAALYRLFAGPRTVSAALAEIAQPCAALLPAAVLFMLSPFRAAARGQDGTAAITYVGGADPLEFARVKVGMFAHAMSDGSSTAELTVTALGIGMAALTTIWAIRRAKMRLSLDPEGIIFAAGILTLFIVTPFTIGDALALDERLPAFMLTAIVIFVQIEWRDRATQTAITSMLCAATLVRFSAATLRVWQQGAIYASFRQAARAFPPDSVLLSAMGTKRTDIANSVFWQPPTQYIGSLATEDGTFVPSMWALRTQHTVALKDSFQGWGREFDVSTQDGVRNARLAAALYCDTWRRLGNDGTVLMVVVYPSAFSSSVMVPRWLGAGWEVVDMCDEKKESLLF